MGDTAFSTMSTGGFKRTAVTGGTGGSNVLMSLRATQMVDTKPFLPAGEHLITAVLKP
jgi:hypothetical protein